MHHKFGYAVRRCTSGSALALVSVLASACTGAIHKEANIGGTDTLSIDARQRLFLVGERKDRHGIKPVRCAEPSPDSLVAMQTVLSASGNAQNIGSEKAGGSAALAARTAESAGSIGYRDSSIQMLRDAYFRLCEAYMNGVLTDEEYSTMIENADTYLAVSSAIQIIGSNPVAPAVAISASGGTTTATDSPNPEAKNETTGAASKTGTPSADDSKTGGSDHTGSSDTADAAKKAKITQDIVRKYLAYRYRLRKDIEAEYRREARSR